MQSSGNRVPLDRSDAIDSGDSPNQRDLGVFYYWTPIDKQKLLKQLVDGGLKGTGNTASSRWAFTTARAARNST